MQDVRRADHLPARRPAGAVVEARRVRRRAAVRVRGVHRDARVVPAVAHRAVLGVGVHRRLGRVDRQLRVVRADAVAVRVRIGEQPPQQHLVRAGVDARHEVRRLEAALLNLAEEVLRVSVQGHLPDLDERVVGVRPHLGEVERVEAVALRIG